MAKINIKNVSIWRWGCFDIDVKLRLIAINYFNRRLITITKFNRCTALIKNYICDCYNFHATVCTNLRCREKAVSFIQCTYSLHSLQTGQQREWLDPENMGYSLWTRLLSSPEAELKVYNFYINKVYILSLYRLPYWIPDFRLKLADSAIVPSNCWTPKACGQPLKVCHRFV